MREADAEALFGSMLRGELGEAQIGAILALLAARLPTIDELVGAARVMRANVVKVPSPAGVRVVDTCGTGGAPKSFNISTAAAFVAAAAARRAGVPLAVAKHGNRSRTGRGSAEVLQALGVNVDASPEIQARCLADCGVCFSFAIHHHPAMKHAAGPRRALGFPTVFNLLGPLTNPAGADRQLLGVYRAEFVPLVAGALARLDAARAMVVHGRDGMDELSTAASSATGEVHAGAVRLADFDPRSLGLEPPPAGSLAARDVAHAAEIIGGVLSGERSPARDIVCLNAGAALLVGDAAASLADGFRLAADAIDARDALRTLDRLRVCSFG